MTVRISDIPFDVPANVVRSYQQLSAPTQKKLLEEFYETILDMKAVEEAEEHNRKHPETYTLDEIKKEFDLD